VNIKCICPPKGDAVRHPGGDTIEFREALDFRAVATIRWAIAIERETDPNASLAEQFGLITEHYVLEGVQSWSVVDAEGKPVDCTKAAIRTLLMPTAQAQLVGDAAEERYQAVMLPLLNGESTSSPPTPTTDSTSPTTGSSEKAPRQLKPSSTSTTPTDATETTSSSLDGVSSSSQSSVSAA
jgi:hypothetical protein